jgi:DNA-directed RNA polymerase subunit RPC12/RpoP
MAKLIDAKCPNCGADLELPADLDRAFCVHCGGKVIIAKDETHYHNYGASGTAIACPECRAKGYFICMTCRGNGACRGSYTNYIGTSPVTTPCQNGWCPKCKGKGFVKKIFYKVPCDYCNNTKVCPGCRGAGKCLTCKGTGRITCSTCKGTGFKVYRGE